MDPLLSFIREYGRIILDIGISAFGEILAIQTHWPQATADSKHLDDIFHAVQI